jgi:flagellin-like protein
MKGVSAVIATILMLMITIALSGMAYMYISGIFTSKTSTGVEVVDTYCAGGNATITLRNIGTTALNVGTTCTATECGSFTVARTSPSAFVAPGDVFTVSPTGSVNPGTTFALVDAACSTTSTGAQTCVYRLTAPGQSTLTAEVYCTP